MKVWVSYFSFSETLCVCEMGYREWVWEESTLLQPGKDGSLGSPLCFAAVGGDEITVFSTIFLKVEVPRGGISNFTEYTKIFLNLLTIQK